ncbi:ABC transporter substrate-binding protein [Alteribacter lacisalsi]|uniref:ABC transporter substrate-binding protein n=1 Tax=Alteribacter lacisalsi TaxID=2045244 RepID=A0A2W0HYY8_9BACI|nr:ABC transporter substrate-binding protein [Alteribacter lacisalsi]PYZ99028.1 ABC transporter substrate-binding protein [Alteribacter lacisalsi]
MKRHSMKALLIGLGMVAVTACAQTEMEQDNAADQDGGDTGDAEETADGDHEETGELTIYTAGPGGMAEELVEAFEEGTGISVDMYQGTTGDVLGRLEAEQGNPIADVVVLASMPPAMQFKEDGMILPYESEYADRLHDGWYDEEHYYYGFSAAALGISYNTNMVDEAPADWSDLAASEFDGQIAIPDPQQSGTARDFVAAYIQQEGDAGWELFEELSENGLSMEGANNPALQTVISGANSAVMAGVDYMVYNNIESGEPIDISFPESGTTITPRPAFILDSAQNVDSAQQYIDFILSDAGQEIVADNYLLPARTDIDAHEDRAGYDEIAELDFDWDYLEENGQDILEDFLRIVR